MPVSPSPKNPLQLLKDFRTKIEQRTNITNFDDDSKIRNIVDPLVGELFNLREESRRAFNSRDISTATGSDLDILGELRTKRLEAQFAKSLASERNVAFYVDSGNFGNINSNNPITIPRGTIIKTRPINTELGAEIKFKTTEDVVLGITENLVYVSVIAQDIGSQSNVGSQTLLEHEFTNYTQGSSRTLKVLNFFPILNGKDRESDESYRYRLANYYKTLVQRNESNYKLAAMEIPGIVDVRVKPGYFGLGTVGVIVLGPEFRTSADLLSRVQTKITSIAPVGQRAIATSAIETAFDFELNIKTTVALNSNQRQQLESDINRALLNYFRSLPLGGIVSVKDIIRYINTTTKNAVIYNPSGGVSLFEKKYVRKGVSGALVDERVSWLSDTWALDEDAFATLGTVTISYRD